MLSRCGARIRAGLFVAVCVSGPGCQADTRPPQPTPPVVQPSPSPSDTTARKPTDRQPYYVVHQDQDGALGYTLLDPTDDFAHVLVVRPLDRPLDAAFDATYEQALKHVRRGSAPEKLGAFQFPEPAYRTREALATHEADLGSRITAASLAKLVNHVGIDEDVHGRLHNRYDGWAEPKPFKRVKGQHRFWRRANGRLLPDMRVVGLPSYDDARTTLTFFTMRSVESEGRSYQDPRVSHYEAWKHVVHLDAQPWRFDEPEKVPEVDVRAKEREVVDAAFLGPVEQFAEMSLPGGARLLLNLDPPGEAKRFVVVQGEQDVTGAYDTLEAMLAAHPSVDRASFVSKLADQVNDFSYTHARVIRDPDAWREGFGKEERVMVGAPMFTLNEDLSDYEIIPAVPAPPFADQVLAPTLEGHELKLYGHVGQVIAEFRWDTRKLTEGECFTRTDLGEEPRRRPIPDGPSRPR